MKEQDIDKIFKDRQHQLEKMPADGVWDRLERKLDNEDDEVINAQTKSIGNWQWLKAAAVILAITIPSLLLFNHFINDKQSQLAQANTTNETSKLNDNQQLSKQANTYNDSVAAVTNPKATINNSLKNERISKEAIKEVLTKSAIKKHPVKTSTAIVAKKVMDKVEENEVVLNEIIEEEALEDEVFYADEITSSESLVAPPPAAPAPKVSNSYAAPAQINNRYSGAFSKETEPALMDEESNEEYELEATEFSLKEKPSIIEEKIVSAPKYDAPVQAIESDAEISNDGFAEPIAAESNYNKPTLESKAIVATANKTKGNSRSKKLGKSANAAYDMADESDNIKQESINKFQPNNADYITNSRPYVDYGVAPNVNQFLWLVQDYKVEKTSDNMAIRQVTDQKLKAKSFKINSEQAGNIKFQEIEVTNSGANLNLKLNSGQLTAYKLIHTLDNEAIFENNSVAYPNQIVFKQLNNNVLNLSLIGIQNGNRVVETIPLNIK